MQLSHLYSYIGPIVLARDQMSTFALIQFLLLIGVSRDLRNTDLVDLLTLLY